MQSFVAYRLIRSNRLSSRLICIAGSWQNGGYTSGAKVDVDAIVEEEPGPAEMAPAMPERTERSVEVGDACVLTVDPAVRREPSFDATVLLPTAVGGEADVEHLISGVRKSVDCLLNSRARGPRAGTRVTTQRSSAFIAAESRWRRQLTELGEPPGRCMDVPFLHRGLMSTITYDLRCRPRAAPFVLYHAASREMEGCAR